MTSIADLHGGEWSIRLRVASRRLRAWIVKRGRPVLPLYEADRPTWWVLSRRFLLLAIVCAITCFYGLLVSILPPSLLVPFAAPPAILALVVIWALPEAPKAPLRALGRSFMIFSVITFLWPNYLAFSFGGLPWISLRRLVGAVAILLFLVSISTSSQVRRQLRDVLKSAPWTSRLIIGFIIVQAISTFGSSAIGESINRLVDASIMWTGMLFIGIWFFSKREQNPDRWINLILIAGTALMVLGAIEYRVEHVLWADHIPSFLQIQDEAVQEILTPHFRDRYRVVTTFTSPLAYGEFLALLAPLILHKLANSRRILHLVSWAGFDLFLLVSAFFSGARLSMVGFIAAHVFYLLLWSIRRWRTHPGGLIGPSLTLMYPALMIGLFIAITSVDALRTRVLGGGATAQSNDSRREQFELAVPAISHRPLFGYGPGEGAEAVGWRTLGGQLSIDSGYLSTAADYGLLGFGFFFGAIIAAIVYSTRDGLFDRRKGTPVTLALAAMFGVLLTTRSVLSQTDNNPFVFMLIGLALAFSYHASRRNLPFSSGKGLRSSSVDG